MFKKVALILSITYLVTSYKVSYSEKLGDNVDDLLKKLKEALDNAEKEANQKISSAQNVLNHKVATIQEQLHTTFNRRNSTFEKNLKNVTDFAANYPVNIDDCLENKEAKMANWTAEGLKEYSECVKPYIQNSTWKAIDAYGKVQQIYDQYDDIENELKECRQRTESTSCLANIMSEINEDIRKLPAAIQDVAKVVTDYANQKQENIGHCGEVQDLLNDMHAVISLNKITACVLHKINHQN